MFNKKSLVLVLFFSLILFYNYASDNFGLCLGTGNDKWNYGLSDNYDDQLSYSALTKIHYKKFFLNAEIGGYTNRGWKAGFDVKNKNKAASGKNYKGRYDRIDFAIGYGFDFDLKNNLFLEIKPALGLVLIGNYKFEDFQNFIHIVQNLNKVDLPYDVDSSVIEPLINGNISFGYKFYKFSDSVLTASINFSTINAINFESINKFNLELALDNYKYEKNVAFLSFGYTLPKSYSSIFTEKLYSKYIDGPEYGFGINSGHVSIDYNNSFNTGFGYSNLIFDIGSLFNDKTFVKEDFWFTTGKTILLKRSFNENHIGMRLCKGLSVVFKNRYASGYPIFNDDDKNTDIRYRRNYSMNSIGAMYEIDLDKKDIFSLYLSLAIGLSDWNITRLYHADENINSFTEELTDKHLFFSDFQVGFNILPENLLVIEYSNYQLTVFGGIVYIPEKNIITRIMITDRSHDSEWSFNGFAPYAGFGVRIGIDI